MSRSRATSVVGAATLVAVTLLASACQWSFARYDAGKSGYNPTEAEVDPGNAGGLHEEWASAAIGNLAEPIVSGATVYVGGASLSAFATNGVDGCSGVPTTCAPLWTAAAGGQPFLANGRLFVASPAAVRAYDPAGVTNCAGSPKVCQPLWTATPGVSQPTVVGDVLVGMSASNAVIALDLNGVTNCSGGATRVCSPLRTYAPNCPAFAYSCSRYAVSAAGDEVFVTEWVSAGFQYRYTETDVYDLSGDRSCSGTPVVCTAIRQTGGGGTTPAVLSGGVQYQSASSGYTDIGFSNSVSAWQLETGPGLWSASLPSSAVGIAAGGGWVAVALQDQLLIYPVGCTGTCAPSRSAPIAGTAITAPSMANGIVVVGTTAGVETFAADGSVGCSGVPATCAPIVILGAGQSFSAIAIADGNIWAAGNDGKLHVFGLG